MLRVGYHEWGGRNEACFFLGTVVMASPWGYVCCFRAVGGIRWPGWEGEGSVACAHAYVGLGDDTDRVSASCRKVLCTFEV